ncbi:MAG: GNAT family N-acetyltransferase [bacterium]|nr:GNAT family N-acetyltransferase [bacterium]
MNNNSIIHNYRDDADLRDKLFEFIDQIYPWAKFRKWHKLGYWSEQYIPYSIIENDKIVANVSVSRMDLIMNGQPANGIQIGTVGTLPEYTGRGYSRQLMELALSRHEQEVDTMFLFANDSVEEFYPKFGFTQQYESFFVKRVELNSSGFRARALAYESETDRSIVNQLLANRLPLTECFGAGNYDFVFYWHWINSFPDSLLYLEQEDAIIIATERDERMNIWDVISVERLEIISLLPKVVRSDKIRKVNYHFPPDIFSFDYDQSKKDEDSLLFVLGKFDTGTRPFKFPTTAQT